MRRAHPRDGDLALRRTTFAGLIVVTFLSATATLASAVGHDGYSSVDIALVTLGGILTAWIAVGFWLSVIGFFVTWRGGDSLALTRRKPLPEIPETLPPTALLVPIRHEDVGEVFARLRAMAERIGGTRHAGTFDFYVLSDSTDPETWIEEEAAWAELVRNVGREIRIFYRHRVRNSGGKCGNIADFCVDWGGLYRYFVVLDADSLMEADTLIRLVRLMEAYPGVGLIQTLPLLIGSDTVFGRMQQFASRVYGPILAVGMSYCQLADGNYWGHNAIIRVGPFMRHCGLPDLPGPPPFGGQILSHDFVEAALIRRGGWEVWFEPCIGGSFETPPASLAEHAKRDRRWCRGNLQHASLLATRGFAAASRAHFLAGIMSYMASPMWLAFLVAAAALAVSRSGFVPDYFPTPANLPVWPPSSRAELFALASAILAMLVLPKILGLAAHFRSRPGTSALDVVQAAAGVVVESILSALIAPILMLSQTAAVCAALGGGRIAWRLHPGRRGSQAVWAEIKGFVPHTLAAAAFALCLAAWAPADFVWFLPVIVGPAVSIPIAALLASPRVGRLTARAGLLTVPAEGEASPLRVRVDELCRTRPLPRSASSIDRVFLDPYLNAIHVALQDPGAARGQDRARLDSIQAQLLAAGPAGLDSEDLRFVLADPVAATRAHAALWDRHRAESPISTPETVSETTQ